MRMLARTTAVGLAATALAAAVGAPAHAFPLAATWIGSGGMSCTPTNVCTVGATSGFCSEADLAGTRSGCVVELEGEFSGVTIAEDAPCVSAAVGSGFVRITDATATDTAVIPVVLVLTAASGAASINYSGGTVSGTLTTPCVAGPMWVFSGAYAV